MLDLSWSELLLVGAVALVVIGPRELPRVLRSVGQTLAKLRRMAGDFQSQFSAAMREAELDEIRTAVTDVKSAADRAMSGGRFDPLSTVRNELRDAIEKPAGTGGSSAAATVQTPPPVAPAVPPAYADREAPAAVAIKPPARQRPASDKHARVIVAAPRDVVKPLARPARGTARLYRKTRFSAFPARPRPARDGEGEA